MQRLRERLDKIIVINTEVFSPFYSELLSPANAPMKGHLQCIWMSVAQPSEWRRNRY